MDIHGGCLLCHDIAVVKIMPEIRPIILPRNREREISSPQDASQFQDHVFPCPLLGSKFCRQTKTGENTNWSYSNYSGGRSCSGRSFIKSRMSKIDQKTGEKPDLPPE